jgi:hypothetical protein
VRHIVHALAKQPSVDTSPKFEVDSYTQNHHAHQNFLAPLGKVAWLEKTLKNN